MKWTGLDLPDIVGRDDPCGTAPPGKALGAARLVEEERDARSGHRHVEDVVERQRGAVRTGPVHDEDASPGRVVKVDVLAIPICEVASEVNPVAPDKGERPGCGEGEPTGSSAHARSQYRGMRDAVVRDGQRPRYTSARLDGIRIRRHKGLRGVVECLGHADGPCPAGLGWQRHHDGRAECGYGCNESLHKRFLHLSTHRALDGPKGLASVVPSPKSMGSLRCRRS